MSRIVDMKALPDGRVRIHWFVRGSGPLRTASGVVNSSMGPITLASEEGHIACDPERKSIAPSREGEVIKLTNHSDDPRAVTCPECMATEEFERRMTELDPHGDRVTIHWFIRDRESGRGHIAGTTGRIACDQSKTMVNPSRGAKDLPIYSDDTRAATCQECRETEEFRRIAATQEQQDRLRSQ